MLKIGRNGGRGIFALYHIDITRVFQFTTSASNASSSTFMVDYLVNSLGFSKQEAIATSSKVSARTLKSTENPDSIVNFLQMNGFNKTHIKKTVYSFPKILSCNIDKTLKPKFEAFQDIGLSGSRLADFISACPRILYRSVDGHILSTLEVIKSVFGDNMDNNLILLRALRGMTHVQKHLPSIVALFQNYGLSVDKIQWLLVNKTQYVRDHKRLQAGLIRVEEKIGIPRDSSMFFRAVDAFCTINEEYLESKFQIYKSFGWTESDILTLARSQPHCLKLSESNIRSTLTFLMKELGYQPADITRYPRVVGYSLQKRLVPRNDVLSLLKKTKLIKLNYSLFYYLSISETSFVKKCVLPFKDKVPGLHDDYMRRVHSPSEAGK